MNNIYPGSSEWSSGGQVVSRSFQGADAAKVADGGGRHLD